MNLNNSIILFLRENLQRLFTKSPFFFKIWSLISLTLVLITGIPDFVNTLSGIVVIPDVWGEHITIAVAWASRAALFMSLLTTQSNTVAITEQGKVLKQTDAKSLPFTATIEKAEILKKAETVPVATVTSEGI